MPTNKDKYYNLNIDEWMSDSSIRLCSPSARGVCIDCLTIMHRSTNYGYLLLNGRALSVEQLSVILSTPQNFVYDGLIELLENGVFSINKNIIFCPKLIKKAKLSEIRILNGKKGGNPILKTATVQKLKYITISNCNAGK